MNSYKLKIEIGGVDKTSRVIADSFSISDEIDENPNICSFDINIYDGVTYAPTVGDNVVVTFDSQVFFSGKVFTIENSGNRFCQVVKVSCKDNTVLLDNILITKRYSSTTINAIIADIIADPKFLGAITDNHVDADIAVVTTTFNTISATKCIQKLADLVGYSWYIDEVNDIHFFAQNTDAAPFNLDNDTVGNYIENSLVYNLDLSQLKNHIRVRGGEKASVSLKSYTTKGDGTALNFLTVFNFSVIPTVTVGGVSKTVGVDYVDLEASFDCFWSFQEKKIRFKVAPSASDVLVFTGYPITPITVLVSDNTSITAYGRYEYTLENKSIKSTEEAQQLAYAQLTAYSQPILEFSFRTYLSGLRSGQNITVNTRSIADTYLIQSVELTALSKRLDTDVYITPMFTVKCSNTKGNSLTSLLQTLLIKSNLTTDLDENVSLEFTNSDTISFKIQENIVKSALDLVGVLAPYYPSDLTTDVYREGRCDLSLKYS